MKSFRSPWFVVVGTVLGLLVGNAAIVQFAPAVLMKPIMAEFGWARSVPSVAVGVATIMAALATPFLGRLIDTRGIKPVTLAGITIFALATAAMAFAPASVFAFGVMFAVMGLFSAAQSPLAYAKSIAAVFDRRRGLALGLGMTGVGLGAAFVPKLTQTYLENFGWRGAFIALGVTIFVVAFPAVLLFLRDTGRSVAVSAGLGAVAPTLPGVEAREAVRNRMFWFMAITFVCIPIAANGVIFHMIALLTDRGIPAESAVGVFAAVGPSLIVGRIVCGWLLDRYHAPFVAVLFIVLPALGVLLLLSSTDSTLTIIGAVLVGLGLGAEVDLIGYIQSRYFGLRAFGQIYGYLFAIFTIGAGLGPAVMGIGFDTFGSYRPILMAFVVILVVAGVMILRLPRTYPYPVVRPD